MTWGTASGAAGVTIFFGLFSKWFPPPPLENVTTLTFRQLQEKYRRTDRLGNWLTPVCFLALSCIAFGLVRAMWWICNRHPDARPLSLPVQSLTLHVLFSLFLALIWSMPLLIFVGLRMLMRDRYDEYVVYGAHRLGWEPRKFTARIFLPLAVVASIFMALAVDTYTVFADDAIYINDFSTLGREQRHTYSEVAAIYSVAGYHGRSKDIDQPHFAIRFTDSSLWTTFAGGHTPNPKKDVKLIRYVIERSGKPLQRIRLQDDIPPLPRSATTQ